MSTATDGSTDMGNIMVGVQKIDVDYTPLIDI